MKNYNYEHPILHRWIDTTVNPYLAETLKRTFNLWVEHYNGNTQNVDSYIESFAYRLDNETTDFVLPLYLDITSKMKEILKEYGIVPVMERVDHDLMIYNHILEAILMMDSYEDVLRLDDILSTGVNYRSVFAELVNTVNPQVSDADVLLVVSEVLESFIQRLSQVITPQVTLAKQQLNNAFSRRRAKINRILTAMKNHPHIAILSDGTNMVSILDTWLDYYYQSDNPETDFTTTVSYIDQILTMINNTHPIRSFSDMMRVISLLIFSCERLFGAIEKNAYLNSITPLGMVTTPQERVVFVEKCQTYLKELYHG